MKPPISLQQIADAAGVSKGTVSLALRNHPRIPESTRKRIRTVADELGYKPNPAVSAWMAHRRQLAPQGSGTCLAFINLWPDATVWNHSPWFTRFVDGARSRAIALGYGFEELRFHETGMNAKRMNGILKARGIRGIIVGSVPEGGSAPDLNWANFAAVAQSHSLKSPELSRSVCDYAHAMRTVLWNLKERGYRRIGYASPVSVEERTDHLHVGAYHVFQAGIPAKYRVPVLDWSRQESVALKQWIERHKPDAIVSHDLNMEQIVRCLDYKVPQEMAVAALCLHPSPTTGTAGFDQRLKRCGEVAVDLLVIHLHHNETGPPERPIIALTRGEWVSGGTA